MATVGSHGKPEQRTFIDGSVKYADEQGNHYEDHNDNDNFDYILMAPSNMLMSYA